MGPVLFWISAGGAAATVGITLLLFVGSRRVGRLADVAPASDLGWPTVSIVFGARDEERHIERAVRSMLALDYPRLGIVAVDDRSTDSTRAILERIAMQDERLQIVRVETLPPRWLGKNHALFVGAKQAAGELLLFTDADIVFEPSTLRRAVTFMQREGLDHLALSPHAVMPGFWLPAFMGAFVIFFSLYARPWNARLPKSRDHIGIGAFNLVRTQAYRAAGTHRAIAMRPDDDMRLGRILKRSGARQAVLGGKNFVTVEWYSTPRQVMIGLEKNLFAGVDYRVLRFVGSTIAQLWISVWPYVGLLVTSGGARWLNLVAVTAWTLICLYSARLNGLPARGAWVFPIVTTWFVLISWRALVLTFKRGGIRWRGTHYSLKDLKSG